MTCAHKVEASLDCTVVKASEFEYFAIAIAKSLHMSCLLASHSAHLEALANLGDKQAASSRRERTEAERVLQKSGVGNETMHAR